MNALGRAVWRLILAVAAAGVLLAGGGAILHAAQAGEADVTAGPGQAGAQRWVVAVPPGLDAPAVTALLGRHGGVLERWLPRLGLALVSLPAQPTAAAIAALSDEPLVDFVTPHEPIVRAAEIPLDPYWLQQWGPARVQGPAAWDLAWGDPSVVVAVVDSGVQQSHYDLAANTWYNPGESGLDPFTGRRTCAAAIASNGIDDDGNGYVDDCRGYDFVDRDTDPLDALGHGTVVAGIAAADTNNPALAVPGAYEGIAGMARRASVMAVRVLNEKGVGYAFDVAAGIDYAVASGAQVINLSLTFPPSYAPDSPAVAPVRSAVEAAQAADVLVVAAAGNENQSIVDCPACFVGVLAVGASTTTDERAWFSNHAARLDLVAPGAGIFSTLLGPDNGSYGFYNNSGSGTSFAAPHAAGAAALVRALRPDLRQGEVYTLLRATADDVGQSGFDIWTGWGRLNAYRAITAALPGLTLALTADAARLVPGAETMVGLRVTAPDGAAAGLGARVTLTASGGVVTPTTVTVDSAGYAGARFIAGEEAGAARITATLGPVQTALSLAIGPGQPAVLTLAAAPTTLQAGDAAVVTATVLDEVGVPVADGVAVTFTATLGTVAPRMPTTAAGQASTVFTAGMAGGSAVVTATVGDLAAVLPLKVIGAGEPWTLTLAAQPLTISRATGPAVITATVHDPFGAVVADGVTVEFLTDLGTLADVEVATVGGLAVTRLGPGATPGLAHVQAIAGNAQGEIAITIQKVTSLLYFPLFRN